MLKAVSNRLARAEARAPAPIADPDPMTADETLFALRGLFRDGSLAMTRGAVTVGPGLPYDGAAELADELTATMAAQPDLLLVLATSDELRRALALVDAGQWFMSHSTRGDGAKVDYRPWPIYRAADYTASAELANTVHLAARVASAQAGQALGYDVSGDLAELRGWLADLLGVVDHDN